MPWDITVAVTVGFEPRDHGRTPRSLDCTRGACAADGGILDPQERLAVEHHFGVSTRQVVRDHVISHALTAIAAAAQDEVDFFGGTALSRTMLPTLRLSEHAAFVVRSAIAKL